jgi:uncharacterized protein YbbC (DUF1343 family)
VRGRASASSPTRRRSRATAGAGSTCCAESPDVNLVALFGPEHGLRGGIEGGVRIETGATRRPACRSTRSTASTQRPDAEMLRDVEVLLFDMQDIGARPVHLRLDDGDGDGGRGRQNIPFIVLDRPNPITSRSAAR